MQTNAYYMRAIVPIEDAYHDVLNKAMRGLGLNPNDLASRAGLTLQQCEALLAGDYVAEAARCAARVLGLEASALAELAGNPTGPDLELPDGIRLLNSPYPLPGYEAMTVNSYSIIPPGGPNTGALIDAGADLRSLLEANQLSSQQSEQMAWQLFITHTHPDHIVHYAALSSMSNTVYVPEGEGLMQKAMVIQEYAQFKVGDWRMTALATPGHSEGGMSYYLEGPERPLVFVGDALFCYSIGKVRQQYGETLQTLRRKLLQLPEETIICPGHGPITTVGFEKSHNPFFANSADVERT